MKKPLLLVAILIFSLLPLAAQIITLTSPNGGENWTIGSTANIVWSSSEVATVRLILYKGGTAAENRIGVIVNGLQASSGSYSWPVGTYIGGQVSAGNDYYIRVRSESDTTADSSAAPFTLSAPPPPSFTLFQPNGNESWEKGSDRSISWMAINMPVNCRLLLLKDGQVLGTIRDQLPPGNQGGSAIPWKVGEYIGGQADSGSGYKIRIQSIDGQTSDTSDNPFTITIPQFVITPGMLKPGLVKFLPPSPDLIVCLNWYGDLPYVLQDVRVRVRLRNIGLGNAPASTFKIYVEGNGDQFVQVPALAPQGEFYWSKKYDWGTCGHKTVRVTADPNGQITESNENNNVVGSSIKVSCGETGFLLEMVNCSDPNQHY